MSRVVSIAHLTLLDVPPPELIELAADAGFDAVGLRISAAGPDDEPYRLQAGSRLLRETCRRMAATGVCVLDVEVARLEPGGDVSAFAPAIETGGELGARYLLVNVYGAADRSTAEGFAQLCELAAPAGLRPVLEPMPYSAVRSLAAALRIVDGSGGGVLVDPLHLQRGGGSTDEVRGLDRALTPYVQLCDAPTAAPAGGLSALIRESRHERLPPGHGELDLRGLLQAVPGQDVAISVEAPSDRLRARHGDRGFARLLRASVDSATSAASWRSRRTVGRSSPRRHAIAGAKRP